MLVVDFMIKADQTLCCGLNTSIGDALKAMMDRKFGSIVVVDGENAIGILTKSDFLRAYAANKSHSEPVSAIMSTNLVKAETTSSRDEMANLFLTKKIHHAIVVDQSGKFVGITSAWDVAREVALDAKAWPYNRSAFKGVGATGTRLL